MKLLVYHGVASSRYAREARPNKPMKLRNTTGCFLVLIGLGIAAFSGDASKSSPGMHAATPTGYDVIGLKPSGTNLSIMGLIECPELEGAMHVSEGTNSKLVSASGEAITEFPQHFSFRITASLRKLVIDGPIASVNVPEDPQELLLKLKFRIRAYSGLESHEIVPEAIEMIGMPADVPYDERIYRISVDAGTIPITGRVIIEILTPEGERLTHFPFSLL